MKNDKVYYKTSVSVMTEGNSQAEILESIVRQVGPEITGVEMLEIKRVDMRGKEATVYFAGQLCAPVRKQRTLAIRAKKSPTLEEVSAPEIWRLP